jgi:DNA modification methylase
MPEGLAEFFIKIASPPGGIVIDPFAGAGTTIIVARRLGRKAAGFEIHEQFINDCRRRMAKNSALSAMLEVSPFPSLIGLEPNLSSG